MGKLIGNVLAFLALAVIVIGVTGYYRGWFTVQTIEGSEDENPQINITFDREKINQDKEKGKETFKGIKDKASNLIQGEESTEEETSETPR